MADTVQLPDVEPLPGEAKSWAKGEAIPKDMPTADAGTSPDKLPIDVSGATGTEAVTNGLADIQRRKMATLDKNYEGLSHNIDEHLATVEEAYKHAGIQEKDLRPWDADKESVKYQTDPLVAFGSLGSVFGILASAFTHQPFYVAMDASAAAINAVKAGDAKAYDRAHKAWEENYNLALKRHEIQRQSYQDAISLMNTNMGAYEAKMKVSAARFGDEKMLFLLEHGMDKEVLELQAARERLTTQMQENLPKIVMANAEMSRLFGLGYDPKHPTSPKSQEAYQKFQKEKAELERMKHSYSFGASNLTTDRQIAGDVASMVDQFKAEHPKATPDEVATFRAEQTRRLKASAAAPTGNRVDELTGKVNRITYMEDTIGKVEELMKKHGMLTGLGGKISRPAEIVGNILGSNETDRKQFERYIAELKEWAPRALTDSNGRPLSSEAGNIETVIAGLRLGDTTANTARAYLELRKLLAKIKQDLQARRSGGGTQQPAPAAEPKPEGDWWKSSPVVH